MEKDRILFASIGLLVGIVAAGLLAGQAVNNNNTGMMRMMGMDMGRMSQSANHNEMSMADMNGQLMKLSGDEFDKAFIEMMIAHHEGAVDMANLAASRAKHHEIKDLSQEIISAQTHEISEMRQWQADWGYADDEMMRRMHGH